MDTLARATNKKVKPTSLPFNKGIIIQYSKDEEILINHTILWDACANKRHIPPWVNKATKIIFASVCPTLVFSILKIPLCPAVSRGGQLRILYTIVIAGVPSCQRDLRARGMGSKPLLGSVAGSSAVPLCAVAVVTWAVEGVTLGLDGAFVALVNKAGSCEGDRFCLLAFGLFRPASRSAFGVDESLDSDAPAPRLGDPTC